MKLRIKYNVSRLIVWKAAIVIYPFMLFRRKQMYVSEQLFRHELQHVYQVEDIGWLKFYVKYLWFSLRYGYKKNPYEIEAYDAQEQPLTTIERHWYES